MNHTSFITPSRLALSGALLVLAALPAAARETPAPAKQAAAKQAAAKPAKNLLVETDPLNVDGTVNVVVVVPAGKPAQVLAEAKARLEPSASKKGAAATFTYGAVPHTTLPKDKGGDGKAADAVILGASAPAGTVVKGRVLGIMVLAGAAEGDSKLIVATEGSPYFGCRNIADLDAKFPGETAKVQTFFTSYKGKAPITAGGFKERAEAVQFLGDAILAFERTFYTEADKRPLDKDGNPSLYPWPGAKNLGE